MNPAAIDWLSYWKAEGGCETGLPKFCRTDWCCPEWIVGHSETGPQRRSRRWASVVYACRTPRQCGGVSQKATSRFLAPLWRVGREVVGISSSVIEAVPDFRILPSES